MASDGAPETSTQQREASIERQEEYLTDQQKEASTEAASSRGAESDCKSQSGDSGDSETASNNSGCLKVAAAAALVGITYDFGPSSVTKGHVGSMESYARYFPKGYGGAPGAESVAEPQANKVVVFKDFFTAGLHMPPHPVLVDILRKLRVQLHHLTLNAIVQISKFIWVVTSCGACPTTDIFSQHYKLCYQHKKSFILKGARLPSLCSLAALPSILLAMVGGRGLLPL
jgi:hypothetical protein